MLIRRLLDKKVIWYFELFSDIMVHKNNSVYSFSSLVSFTLNVHLQIQQLKAGSFPASPLGTLSGFFFCRFHLKKKKSDSEKVKMALYHPTVQNNYSIPC